MSLKLFDRIATLLKADAHGVIDSIEERSLLLKQYLREAETELNRKRARLAAVRDEEKRVAEALATMEADICGLDEDIGLALEGDKDDLARFAIRRLLPLRAESTALRRQFEQRRKEGESLGELLTEQEGQFENLRVRVRTELTSTRVATESPLWLGDGPVAEEEVEIELMRRRQAAGERP